MDEKKGAGHLLANVPVVVDIGKIEPNFEPRNKTMTLLDQWGDDATSGD
jgi:hypothetical protein